MTNAQLAESHRWQAQWFLENKMDRGDQAFMWHMQMSGYYAMRAELDKATPQPKNPNEGGSRGPEKPDVPLGEPQKNPDPGIEEHPHKARPLPPRRPNDAA